MLMTNNKYLFERIAKFIKKDNDIQLIFTYDKDTDKLIKKIQKNNSSKEIDNIVQFLSQTDCDILDLNNIEALALIKRNLYSVYAMQILEQKDYVFSIFVLTLGLHYNHPLLVKAIKNIKFLSLENISHIIDLKFLSIHSLNMILPSVIDEIIENTKYDFLLGNTSNDDIIQKYIKKEKFSQNQLRVICENEHLSNNTRDSAFNLLEDAFAIDNMTEYMKMTIYESVADIVFTNLKDSVRDEYVVYADNYFKKATKQPQKYLLSDLQIDFVKRCFSNFKEEYRPYIDNLINSTTDTTTLKTILSLSKDKIININAIMKTGQLSKPVISDIVESMIDKLTINEEIDSVDMKVFDCILNNKYSSYIKITNYLSDLLDICFGNTDNESLSKNIQYLLVSNAYIDKEIVQRIERQTQNDTIRKLAQVNLDIEKTNITKEEQHNILQILNVIFNDSENLTTFFNKKLTVIYSEPDVSKIFTYEYSLKPDVLSFCKITKSDYSKIKNAISIFGCSKKINSYSTNGAFNSFKKELKNSYNNYKNNSSKDITKYTNKMLIKYFSEMFKKIQEIRNPLGCYEFVQNYGKHFGTVINEISKRLKNGSISKTEIPENITEAICHFTDSR